MSRVIVLGSLNVDLEVHVPVLPDPGQKVMGDRLSRFAGGKGGNQAVAARAVGVDVIMVGSVGDDEVGRKYLNRLASLGIMLEVTRQVGMATGHAFITTNQAGINQIVVVPGANLHIAHRPLDPIRHLGSGDLVLTQMETPPDAVCAAVRHAAERGARVMLNLSPYVDLPDDVIEVANPLVIHHTDVSRLKATGALPASLLVTRGAQGITWDQADFSVDTVPDSEVVDTIGAGDAFVGTLAAALVQGRSNGVAAQMALQAAAEGVRRFGAQPNPRL